MVEAEASNDVGWPGPAAVATKEATGRWSGVTAMAPSPGGHVIGVALKHVPSAPGALAAPVMLTVRFLPGVVISTVLPSGVANRLRALSSTRFKLRGEGAPPGMGMPTTRTFTGSPTYRMLCPAGVVAIARVPGSD